MDYMHVLDSLGKRTGKMTATRLKKVYADDGSDFKPMTIKPNTAGDPDYQGAIFFPDVTPGTTPYPNAAITRKTNFHPGDVRKTGYWGGPATVYIPAGKYGGEAPGNADALAEGRVYQ